MKTATDVNVMFFHGKTIDGSRFTIAGTLDDNLLKLGIAICGDNENFVKEKGRAIATGRLLNQRHPDLGGRIEHPIPPSEKESKDFTRFTSEVSQLNNYTKKQLIKEFCLRRPNLWNEYFDKRNDIIKEFRRTMRELDQIYGF